MSKKEILACLLAGFSLAACDTLHSVQSYSALSAPPEAACVERVLKADPDVAEVKFEATESHAFGLTPRWGPQTTYSSVWRYQTAQRRLWIQILRTPDSVYYSNGRLQMNARISTEDSAIIAPVIARVDTALIAQCGLKPLKPLTVVHR
jgi:hypothetical protein